MLREKVVCVCVYVCVCVPGKIFFADVNAYSLHSFGSFFSCLIWTHPKVNDVLSRFATRGMLKKRERKERKNVREKQKIGQELWSVRSWRRPQWWDCLGAVPGDLSLGPVIWEDCEPVDTLQMDLNIQIPFATFLFGSPCSWLSPPSCLSWAIIWVEDTYQWERLLID